MTTTLSSRSSTPPIMDRTYPSATLAAAAAALLSAGIHLYVTPEHFAEWWVFGVFFLMVAVGQLLSAALVLFLPRPTLLVAMVAANLAVVVTWVVSRTSGLPFHPEVVDVTAGLADPALGGYGGHAAHVHEHVGVLDASATVLELLALVALCALMPARLRRWTVNVLFVVGLSMWGLYGLGVLG